MALEISVIGLIKKMKHLVLRLKESKSLKAGLKYNKR